MIKTLINIYNKIATESFLNQSFLVFIITSFSIFLFYNNSINNIFDFVMLYLKTLFSIAIVECYSQFIFNKSIIK